MSKPDETDEFDPSASQTIFKDVDSKHEFLSASETISQTISPLSFHEIDKSGNSSSQVWNHYLEICQSVQNSDAEIDVYEITKSDIRSLFQKSITNIHERSLCWFACKQGAWAHFSKIIKGLSVDFAYTYYQLRPSFIAWSIDTQMHFISIDTQGRFRFAKLQFTKLDAARAIMTKNDSLRIKLNSGKYTKVVLSHKSYEPS